MAKYYSEAANFLGGIVHAGCLRKNFTKITEIIRKGVSDGRIDQKYHLSTVVTCALANGHKRKWHPLVCPRE